MLVGVKRLVVSVVCAQALVLGACGGPVTESQPEELGTSRDALSFCDGTQEWVRDYYSDFYYTHWVGQEWCGCDGTRTLSGTRTRYYQDASFACY